VKKKGSPLQKKGDTLKENISDALNRQLGEGMKPSTNQTIDFTSSGLSTNQVSLHSFTLIRETFGWDCNLSSHTAFLSPA
jgi:hypothetical protein